MQLNALLDVTNTLIMNSTISSSTARLLHEIEQPGANATPDKPIFHYTSSSGVIPILQGRTIWASNARFLNDSSELILAYKIVAEIANEKKESWNIRRQGSGANFQSLADTTEGKLLHLIVHEMNSIEINKNLDAYIACFCNADDMLSQWRGYAGSGGYSLGLCPRVLLESARATASTIGSTKTRVILQQVVYEHDEWRAIVNRLIDEMLESVLNHASKVNYAYVDQLLERYISALSKSVARAAPFLKDRGFKEENEIRLSLYTNSSVGSYGFRSTDMGIVPYVSVPLGDALISVRVGPSRNYELQMRSLHLMSLGADVKIEHSAVPFRT